MNNSKLTIKRSILKQNVETIAKNLKPDTQILAVIKANAYGLGIIEVAKTLETETPVYGFGIAQTQEGIALREAGITKPIMFLAGITDADVATCIDNKLQILVHNQETLNWLETYHNHHPDTVIEVNLKINTTFNRFGFKVGEELQDCLLRLQSMPYIKICSTYSHPIEGEVINSELTRTQHTLFLEGLEQMHEVGINPGKTHFCNSGACDWFKEGHHDLVRLGRMLYMDSLYPQCQIGIQEPMTWTATVTSLRKINIGESSGYNQAFIASKPTDLAVISAGYGDGLILHKASQTMPAFINGNTCHIVAVCMDSAMLDITGIDVKIGDDVILFGTKENHTLTSQAVAQTIGQEGCTITTLISQRVQREYRD